jgi:hypothetical protein
LAAGPKRSWDPEVEGGGRPARRGTEVGGGSCFRALPRSGFVQRAERRYGAVADRFRKTLVEWLGEEKGQDVKAAKSFEIYENGSQPIRDELRRLFSTFDGKK